MNPTPPKTVGVATQLISLSILLALVIDMVSYASQKLNASPTAHLIDATGYILVSDTVSFFIIMVLCAYFIYQGKNWARLLLVFYFCFRLFMHFITNTTEPLSLLLGVLILAYLAILIIAITLLFTPEGNAWFRGEPLKTKHSVVNIAIIILIVDIAVFIAINAIAFTYFRYEKINAIAIPFNSAIALMIDTPIHLVIMIPILIALCYKKNWARIALVIYVIARIIFHFYSYPLVTYTESFELMVLLFFVLNLIAATLLFCPESNRWFKPCQPQQ
ncbi:MAG: hypothetical protein P1U34_11105 [Coxiellaceae bacterium]|nr:hypothetical protein [Coxiellaceae bacterium]